MAIDPQFDVELTADELNNQIPMSILYGVTPGDKFIPIRIDSDGRLQISSDMSINVDDVDILIKGVDPENGNSEHRIAVENLGVGNGYAIRSSLFNGANQLAINLDGSINVNATGSGAVTDDDDGAIAVGQTGILLNLDLMYGYNGATWERIRSSSGRLVVDGSQVTQPISAVSLPLPTGASTEATLATRSSEATLSGFRTDFNAEDFATETTLATRATEATALSILGQLDVALSTRASESTLSTINSKLNTLGQKTMVGSVPVVLASDQSTLPVSVVGTTTDVDDDSIASGQTLPLSLQLLYGYDGATWERLGSTGNALDVNIKSGVTLEVNLDNANDDVLVYGFDGSVNKVILTDTSGRLLTDPIDKVAREIGRVSASDVVFVNESYATADAFANARPSNGNFVTRHYKSKHLVLKNTGANGSRVNIAGSIDNGTNFDVVITNNTILGSGNTMLIEENRAFTHIRVEAQSQNTGNSTTVETRGYAMGT